MTADRNFDDIAEHFAKKVYGGLKGQIRLAVLQRDLAQVVADLGGEIQRPLQILDIGAGLGQVSLTLAKAGHHCTLTDISANMLSYAKAYAKADGLNCQFFVAPYQALPEILGNQQFDLILCHAVLEWVDNPRGVVAMCERFLRADGVLSLCFYNPAAKVYRNLMMGNFNYLNNPKPADSGSLTPNHPVPYETVRELLADWIIVRESGIRVFSDYATQKRGGLANPDAVIAMELQYSDKLPYRLMGRYLHIMAKKRS